jgi:Ca2+-binding RTX toxin-like protein
MLRNFIFYGTILLTAVSLSNRADAIDLPANTTTTARLTLTNRVAARFEKAGDEDWVRLQLTGGTRYKIGYTPGDTDVNTFRILNSSGSSTLASSSRGQIEYKAPNSGTFFLAVKGYADSIGAYYLEMYIDNEAPNIKTTARMTVGAPFRSTAQGPSVSNCGSDNDWIGVNLLAGTTYYTSLDKGGANEYVFRLRNPSGLPISPDREFFGATELKCFFIPINGLYFIEFNVVDACGDVYNIDIKQGCAIGSDSVEFVNLTSNNDLYYGLGGADTINGLAGNDLIDGGPGNDTINGGDGFDVASYASSLRSVDANLAVNPARVSLLEVAGVIVEMDILQGIEGVVGSSLADVFVGNVGANLFEGGLGSDRFTGGDGADRFLYASSSDSAVGSNRESITDFTVGQDKIDLSKMDADDAQVGNQTFTFLTAVEAAFTARGQLRYRYGGPALTLVEGNVTGDLLPDFQIALFRRLALSAADFVR